MVSHASAQASVWDLINSGSAKHQQHDYHGAKEDFDKALGIQPKNAEALRCRGETKRMLRDFHGAIRDFDECLKISPENSFALGRRGERQEAGG